MSATQQETLKKLRLSRVFAGLPDETLRHLAGWVRFRHYRQGMFIFLEGEPADSFFFVVSGRVKVVKNSRDGEERILRLLHGGDAFSLIGFLQKHASYPATTVALSPTEVGIIPAESLAQRVQEDARLAWHLLQVMSTRLRWAQSQMLDFTFRDARSRVAALLVRQAAQEAPPNQEEVELPLLLTHQEVAQLVGTTRETVTKVLGEFRNQGFVRMIKPGHYIVFPQPLRKIAGPSGLLAE